MTARPHDALFRSAFEDPEHATAELRHVLPEALVAALDWSTLRTEPGAYVDSELADRYSDLLFSAHTGGRRLLVYLLLEHQSTVDEHMPLRMLIYMTRIWERWSSERPAERLPPIVPVLVSHARTRPVLTRMHDLFAPPPSSIPGLAEHVPQFRILLDDIASATDDDLTTERSRRFRRSRSGSYETRATAMRCSSACSSGPTPCAPSRPRRTACRRCTGSSATSTSCCPIGASSRSMA